MKIKTQDYIIKYQTINKTNTPGISRLRVNEDMKNYYAFIFLYDSNEEEFLELDDNRSKVKLEGKMGEATFDE